MLDAQTTVIRGRTFQTIPFGARRQLELLPGVLRLTSGPLGALIESAKGLGGGPLKDIIERKRAGERITAESVDVEPILKALNGDALRAGLLAIAAELEGGGLDLFLALLRDTHRLRGKSQHDGLESCADDFDTVFASDLMTLAQVLVFVVRVNYAPFLTSSSGKSDSPTAKKRAS
jgi:hypothetical protein